MKLPRIYKHFQQGQVFTIEEARRSLGTTGNTLRKRLSELAAKKYILQIRQGLYQVCRLGELHKKSPTPPFAIAAKVAPYCYVAYHSALLLHACHAPRAHDFIYIVSPSKFNHFKFENRTYFWCQSSEPHGLQTILLKDGDLEYPVLVTNFEKSIVDCLKRPTHCPSFFELVQLSRQCAKPDIDKILKYARDCQVQSIFNRIGLLFEKNRDWWGVDGEIFRFIEKNMNRKLTDWPISTSPQPKDLPLEEDWGAFVHSILESKVRWKIQFHERVV